MKRTHSLVIVGLVGALALTGFFRKSERLLVVTLVASVAYLGV